METWMHPIRFRHCAPSQLFLHKLKWDFQRKILRENPSFASLLYETGYFAWTKSTAAALRDGRVCDVDLAAVVVRAQSVATPNEF